jgi:hypothetical protein
VQYAEKKGITVGGVIDVFSGLTIQVSNTGMMKQGCTLTKGYDPI